MDMFQCIWVTPPVAKGFESTREDIGMAHFPRAVKNLADDPCIHHLDP